MIREETASGWVLVKHRDHAQLAGDFAAAWGNAHFAPPEPFAKVHYAVAHHDDGWIARDSTPQLTREGRPEAFTRTLVGAYAAFEEIDLPSYLEVRGAAAARVASHDPFAGVLVSMHTVNLLTEQADLATIRAEHRPSYDAFIRSQRAWQQETAERIGASPVDLQRGFEFLQCCDSLSLIACSGYDAPRDLRHTHSDVQGRRHTLRSTPRGAGVWLIAPWPFREPCHGFDLPYREIPAQACGSLAQFRAAFEKAPVKYRTITLTAAP